MQLVFKKLTYQCLIKHMKSISHKRQEFLTSIFKTFGIERLADASFIYSIAASQLGLDYRNLKRSINRWLSSGMKETQGTLSLPIEVHQAIYDMWVACSIPSTDDRNDRVTVKISKLTYLRKY